MNSIAQYFIDWSKNKIRYHFNNVDKTFYFREKEIWWAAMGQNIGFKVNGKHQLFERPVLIIKKYSEDVCFILPLSTKIKSPLQQRNKKLAQLHPDCAKFLENINEGMFDLRNIFSENNYVDSAFKGSSSIKNVLPVIVPELTYKSLNISKGDQASERWEKMISSYTPKEEKKQIEKDLREYCKMDTWAMVKIYEFLRKVSC